MTTLFRPPEFSYEQKQIFSSLRQTAGPIHRVKPSQFVRFAITVRVVEEGKPPEMRKFSFAQRRYLRQIYNTPSRRVLLMCGRQVEKSTTLGNTMLARCCIVPGYMILFVSPSQQQTTTFSRDRLKDPMETSAELSAWTSQALSDSVKLKQFLNRSKITLRYAYHNADRTRGVTADEVDIDEIQDINIEFLPVILECASHSPYKIYRFSGTPKSLDNTIEYYWANHSTQNEWAVPCRRHGIPGTGKVGRHWNILGERNIGKKGLVCNVCGELINPADPEAQWVSNATPNVDEPYEGFRIPQLMVPWIGWSDLLAKYEEYPRARFFNEVLGRSYDSGTRPLTQQDLIDNCLPGLCMYDQEQQAELRKKAQNYPVYMGVDWGTGEGTYTVVTLGAYINGFFTIFFAHRFTGHESEPKEQIRLVKQLFRAWGVRRIGVDYGGGFWQNDELFRTFGPTRVSKYQYAPTQKKVKWDDNLRRFLVHRSEVMSDFFNGMKRKNVFRFPRWEDFADPYGKDFLNIYSQYNENTKANQYMHSPGVTDDTMHSALYCFLASFVEVPRPDVIRPMKEIQNAA